MKKKILVVSDSHNNYKKLEAIIKEEAPFDYIVHCGDGAGDLLHIDLPWGVNVIRVLGNVDVMRGCDFDRCDLIVVNQKKIYVTHGDLFHVKNDCTEILLEGERKGADVILFGHTHIQFQGGGSPVLFNPGYSAKGFYGIVEVGDSEITFYHKSLKK